MRRRAAILAPAIMVGVPLQVWDLMDNQAPMAAGIALPILAVVAGLLLVIDRRRRTRTPNLVDGQGGQQR